MEKYLLKRIERMLLVMSEPDLANYLGVVKRTIQNWRKEPGKIQAQYIDPIKKLHVEFRYKIKKAIHHKKHPPLYVVYSHSVNGRIIYIGSGGRNRPYNKDRSDIYRSAVAGCDVEIKIISEHNVLYDARLEERLLIREIKPECNVNFNSNSRRKDLA